MSRVGTTILVGLAASPGIAIGRCWTIDRRRVRTPRRKLGPEEVEPELARLKNALEVSDLQLADVRAKITKSEAGGAGEDDRRGLRGIMSRVGTTILVGLAASPGIAIGRCWTIDRRRVRTPKRKLGQEEVEPELLRLKNALE